MSTNRALFSHHDRTCKQVGIARALVDEVSASCCDVRALHAAGAPPDVKPFTTSIRVARETQYLSRQFARPLGGARDQSARSSDRLLLARGPQLSQIGQSGLGCAKDRSAGADAAVVGFKRLFECRHLGPGATRRQRYYAGAEAGGHAFDLCLHAAYSGNHSKTRLPLCVWQAGRSYRREQEQPTKQMRLKEFLAARISMRLHRRQRQRLSRGLPRTGAPHDRLR